MFRRDTGKYGDVACGSDLHVPPKELMGTGPESYNVCVLCSFHLLADTFESGFKGRAPATPWMVHTQGWLTRDGIFDCAAE